MSEEVTYKSMYQHGYTDALKDVGDLICEKLEEIDNTDNMNDASDNLSSKMKIGYIARHNMEKFEFIEASFTRRSSSRGDRVYSRILACSVDYKEILDNANIMKKNPRLILVREPFLLDDELKEKVTKWVEWANQADEKEYDPFAKCGD